VGRSFLQGVSRQQACAGHETSLGTGDFQALPAKNIVELAGQPMDGMPLRHYSTISPVVS
jgi:hypothetical protein